MVVGVPRKSSVELVDFEPRYGGCLLAVLVLLEVLLLRVVEVGSGALALALALGGA